MRKYTCLILFISLFALSINAQEIPNGDFEEWEILPPFNSEIPVGWITSNFSGVPAGIEANAVKTTDAYQGSYAIKLSTVDGLEPSEPHVGVALYDGEIDHTPSELRGYYKTSLVGGDITYISVNVLSGGAFIGASVIEFETNQSEYTYFSLPIDYIVENPVADHFYLSILSSIEDGIVGSSITVDNLHFDGSTAVIDFGAPKVDIVVSPNPVSDLLEISMDKYSDDLNMTIYDTYGRLVESKQINNHSAIDVSEYPQGQYFIELRSAKKTLIQSTRFIVSR